MEKCRYDVTAKKNYDVTAKKNYVLEKCRYDVTAKKNMAWKNAVTTLRQKNVYVMEKCRYDVTAKKKNTTLRQTICLCHGKMPLRRHGKNCFCRNVVTAFFHENVVFAVTS